MNKKRYSLLRDAYLDFVFADSGNGPWVPCARCGTELSNRPWVRLETEFEVDHVEPRSQAPEKLCDPMNLQLLCQPCNVAKGAKPRDFRTEEQIDRQARWAASLLFQECCRLRKELDDRNRSIARTRARNLGSELSAGRRRRRRKWNGKKRQSDLF